MCSTPPAPPPPPPPPPPTPILLFHFIMVPTSSEFMGYYWVTFSEKQEVDDVKGLSLWAIRLWLFKLIRIVPINYPSGEFFVKNTDWKLAGPEKLSTISSKKDRKSSNVEGNGASWAVWELGCEHIFQKMRSTPNNSNATFPFYGSNQLRIYGVFLGDILRKTGSRWRQGIFPLSHQIVIVLTN